MVLGKLGIHLQKNIKVTRTKLYVQQHGQGVEWARQSLQLANLTSIFPLVLKESPYSWNGNVPR